jgi:hypothetical protein
VICGEFPLIPCPDGEAYDATIPGRGLLCRAEEQSASFVH